MDLPPFEHGRLLQEAWARGAPEHNLGGSGFSAPAWRERGLPVPLPQDADPAGLDLHPGVPLRDALADRHGHPREGTLVTAGTTGANLAVLLALVRPGRRVVCERPGYQVLPNLARRLGADVAFVDRDPEQAWRLDPGDVEELLDDDTDLVLLTSPNNPTQAAAPAADLRRLGDAAAAHGARVLADQVYRELADHTVAATEHAACITTAGFNKSWGAPGLRTGWVLADPATLPALHDAHLQAALGAPRDGAARGRILLDHEAPCRRALEARLAENLATYRHACEAMAVDPGPHAALTDFLELPVGDVDAWCRHARAGGLLVLPGSVFGDPCRVRLGLGGDPAATRRALDALTRCLRGTG